METLIYCNTPQEAYLIKGKLANEGIESVINNELSSVITPHFQNTAGGGIRVEVLADDFEKAYKLISE